MPGFHADELGRRERQIMDVLFRLGRASVAEVLRELPDPPTYSAVRGMLRLLEEKGFIVHERDGLRYVYLPAGDTSQARRSALRHLVKTFFGGSGENAVAALLDLPETKLTPQERRRLLGMIRKARAEGR
ncbi:MAG TPA: BlaI/MecI/CopY family transcriptional regulator [Candidatus Acidoferrum sp.]|nr:BlaI/MecI/CopY family transcriptional regulator [Candidatus Acidoferrum sp.]